MRKLLWENACCWTMWFWLTKCFYCTPCPRTSRTYCTSHYLQIYAICNNIMMIDASLLCNKQLWQRCQWRQLHRLQRLSVPFIVFMVCGIQTNWKKVVVWYPTGHSTPGLKQWQICREYCGAAVWQSNPSVCHCVTHGSQQPVHVEAPWHLLPTWYSCHQRCIISTVWLNHSL